MTAQFADSLREMFPQLRKRKLSLVIVITVVAAFLGLPFCTQVSRKSEKTSLCIYYIDHSDRTPICDVTSGNNKKATSYTVVGILSSGPGRLIYNQYLLHDFIFKPQTIIKVI